MLQINSEAEDDGTCTYDSAIGNDIIVSSNITTNTNGLTTRLF